MGKIWYQQFMEKTQKFKRSNMKNWESKSKAKFKHKKKRKKWKKKQKLEHK